MPRWDGFAAMRHKSGRVTVHADIGGSDDDPTPLAGIHQVIRNKDSRIVLDDLVELTESELRWLVEDVAPKVLKRMGERP